MEPLFTMQVHSLRQALEQSQEAQRRLQHSNQVLQDACSSLFTDLHTSSLCSDEYLCLWVLIRAYLWLSGAPQGTPECMSLGGRLARLRRKSWSKINKLRIGCKTFKCVCFGKPKTQHLLWASSSWATTSAVLLSQSRPCYTVTTAWLDYIVLSTSHRRDHMLQHQYSKDYILFGSQCRLWQMYKIEAAMQCWHALNYIIVEGSWACSMIGPVTRLQNSTKSKFLYMAWNGLSWSRFSEIVSLLLFAVYSGTR